MTHLEESIRAERKEREAQLRNFSSELEATMRGLIERIDERLSSGAAAMRERTDATESRLRSLINRVDEGLSVGAAALQDTLNASFEENQMQQPGLLAAAAPALASAGGPGAVPPSGPSVRRPTMDHAAQPLGRPRQMLSSPLGMTPGMSPSSGLPQTLQVPGSGLQPARGGGPGSVGSAGGASAGPGPGGSAAGSPGLWNMGPGGTVGAGGRVNPVLAGVTPPSVPPPPGPQGLAGQGAAIQKGVAIPTPPMTGPPPATGNAPLLNLGALGAGLGTGAGGLGVMGPGNTASR